MGGVLIKVESIFQQNNNKERIIWTVSSIDGDGKIAQPHAKEQNQAILLD